MYDLSVWPEWEISVRLSAEAKLALWRNETRARCASQPQGEMYLMTSYHTHGGTGPAGAACQHAAFGHKHRDSSRPLAERHCCLSFMHSPHTTHKQTYTSTHTHTQREPVSNSTAE